MRTAIIIGAGPAGLTAAFEILSQKTKVKPIVLEATERIGGISCTIKHNGNRIDLGGHRFFSKSDQVMDWWEKRMPAQGFASSDDLLIHRKQNWSIGGPDPQTTSRVMLIRNRVSRILYQRKLFDYPLSINFSTMTKLGIHKTVSAGLGYLKAQMTRGGKEHNLEDFLIKRFGKPLYTMFFKDYTQKVWGIHPKRISSAWGAQRIKGLSLFRVIWHSFRKMLVPMQISLNMKQKDRETSLIEKFLYPKYGPGHFWESVADDIIKMGGEIHIGHRVTGIVIEGDRVTVVETEKEGNSYHFFGEYIFSSMPIKDLFNCIKGELPPMEISEISQGLQYRDFMTVGVLVEKLSIKNSTRIKSVGEMIPDVWIYIQENDVKLCRLQVFNNWSPYMVSDHENTVWLGLEYMCHENDKEWKMNEGEFIEFAIDELVKLQIIERVNVLDACRIKVEKAYPAYFGTYDEFDRVKGYLNGLQNLYCMGRNGQHRYNNQDHSMLTAMKAVECMLDATLNKEELWSINAEKAYHETKARQKV